MDQSALWLALLGGGGVAGTVITALISHILNRRKDTADINKTNKEAESTAAGLHKAALESAMSILAVIQQEKKAKDAQLDEIEHEYDEIAVEVKSLQVRINTFENQTVTLKTQIARLESENIKLRSSLVGAEKIIRAIDPVQNIKIDLDTIEGFSHPSYADVFFKSSTHAIAYTTRDGTFSEVNDKWIAMLGYSRAELRNLTIQDVTHPEDFEGDSAMVHALLDNPKIQQYTVRKRYITKDSETLWVNLYVRPIWVGGHFRHFIKFAVLVATAE